MNIGPTEIIVVLVIALLVFGPGRLPQMGRSLGHGLREFKHAAETAKEQLGLSEVIDDVNEVKNDVLSAAGVDEIKESIAGVTSTHRRREARAWDVERDRRRCRFGQDGDGLRPEEGGQGLRDRRARRPRPTRKRTWKRRSARQARRTTRALGARVPRRAPVRPGRRRVT